ncbi:hypothetical protein B7494_g1413 [Chlorociboria aeruginascens]|nr:hypothetical protein B7494_g1413 [Chlorociboria aeruginascens]
MAPHTTLSVLLASACIISPAFAINSQLVGTWSTKSAKVLTGPGFYNPINDSFIEPSLTGISYSFTSDGFYEEAYYRAIANLYTDPYSKLMRLDLYEWDGTPMNPMYLAYRPPQMLPTVTMNPTATAAASASATAKAKRWFKRDGEEREEVIALNKDAAHIKRSIEHPLLQRIDLNMLWWAGVAMTIFGGAAYIL